MTPDSNSQIPEPASGLVSNPEAGQQAPCIACKSNPRAHRLTEMCWVCLQKLYDLQVAEANLPRVPKTKEPWTRQRGFGGPRIHTRGYWRGKRASR